MPRTVKELMAVVLDAACVIDQKDPVNTFCTLSEGHKLYWEKLLHLGRSKGKDPEAVPDIDATTELTEQEYVDLELEFIQLHRRSRPSLHPPSHPPSQPPPS
jgi:hypothetical protein